MPSYMGFFISKSLSLAWALLKTFKIVPESVPFEKMTSLAVLSGLVGFVSFKNSQKRALKQKLERINSMETTETLVVPGVGYSPSEYNIEEEELEKFK